MPQVWQRAAARRDLLDHFVYLAENAGAVTAERFLAQAQASFGDLALQPLMGAPLTLQHPDLAGMRKWRVKDFDSFLVFHLPRPGGVSVVRVLHASRDWWGLLGIEAPYYSQVSKCVSPRTPGAVRGLGCSQGGELLHAAPVQRVRVPCR